MRHRSPITDHETQRTKANKFTNSLSIFEDPKPGPLIQPLQLLSSYARMDLHSASPAPTPSSLLQTIETHQAILTSPSSTPQQITTSSEVLSSLHPSLASLLSLSNSLLSSPSAPSAKLFHHLLSKQLHPAIYTALPNHSKQALIQLSTSLLPTPTRHSTNLHAQLAVREWPQNWPSFLPTLLDTPSACAVIADLSDAVYVHPGVSAERSQEIIHALALSLEQILPMIIKSLPEDDAFRAAEAVLQWATVETLFTSGLVEVLVRLFYGGHWEDAIKCLQCLVERRVETVDAQFRELFKALLAVVESSHIVIRYIALCQSPPSGEMPNLRRLWESQAGVADKEAQDFVSKFFQLLADLGTVHFTRCFLFSRRGAAKLADGEIVVAAAFVDLLLAGLSHPATAIRLSVLPFFTGVLNNIHKNAHESPLGKYLVEGFFHSASAALLPHEDPMKQLYEDSVDFSHACNNFSARVTASLSTASNISPTLSTSAFVRMRGLLTIPPGNIGRLVRPTARGQAWVFHNVPLGTFEACLEAASTAADAVASGVTDKGNEAFLREMRTCFEALLNLSEPSLQPLRAHAVRAFIPLFRIDSPSLDRCVELLGSFITQRKTRIRYRACTSLSVLFRRLDGVGIDRYAGPLCEYCLRALGKDFHNFEKIHLVEATLTSVQAIQSFDERLMYVERVLLPVLDILSKPDVTSMLASPSSLFKFLDLATLDQVAPVVGAFMVFETSAHHLVRPISKTTGPIPLPGVLSRSIAPKSVNVTCMLITCLHGMYNRQKFSVDANDDSLHPTSREVAYLVNLESQKGIEPAPGEKQGSLAEQRAAETLKAHGVDPPSATHSWLRETLRDLRKSGYEILRAAILSGVTQSPAHLKSLVEAVCSDFQYIEPLHLLLLITRVLHPLLSHPVVTAGPGYLESLSQSPIPALLRHIRQHIDACQNGKTVFSSSATMDIAHDHARRAIARAAADMLAAIYPRREPTKADDNKAILKHSPLAFKAGELGVELALLWQTICNPGQSRLDQGASRVGFGLIVTAAEMAPLAEFPLFAPLLHGSLRTAVLNAGAHAEDSPAQIAISALLAVIRKWPSQSEAALHMLGAHVRHLVTEAVREVLKAKPKKQRATVKALVEHLAKVEGTKEDKEEVQALPQKLVTVNPARAMNRPRNELEEIVFGDMALDSLFGEGDPL